MSDIDAASTYLSIGIGLLFLGYALCALIDEVRDILLDRLHEKRKKLLEKQG